MERRVHSTLDRGSGDEKSVASWFLLQPQEPSHLADYPVRDPKQGDGDGDERAELGQPRQDPTHGDGRLEEREAVRAAATTYQPERMPHHSDPV